MTKSTESNQRPAQGHRRAGFTLIEILIVLAIILLLAGLVSVSLFNRRDQADIDITKINLSTLSNAMEQFRFDFRRYPNDDEGVTVLWEKERLDPEADGASWKGPYLTKTIPTDSWGKPWGYRQQSDDYEPGAEGEQTGTPPFDLWSNGPDGEEGTEDDIRTGRAAPGSADDQTADELLPAGAP